MWESGFPDIRPHPKPSWVSGGPCGRLNPLMDDIERMGGVSQTSNHSISIRGGLLSLVVVRIDKHLWCVLYHWVKADPGGRPPSVPPAFQLRRRTGVVTGSSPDAPTKNTAYMSAAGRVSFPPLSRRRQLRHSGDWTMCAERRCWSLFAFQKFH